MPPIPSIPGTRPGGQIWIPQGNRELLEILEKLIIVEATIAERPIVQAGESEIEFTASENSTEVTVKFPKELKNKVVVLTANFSSIGFVVMGVTSLSTIEMKVRGAQPGKAPTGKVKFYWMAS